MPHICPVCKMYSSGPKCPLCGFDIRDIKPHHIIIALILTALLIGGFHVFAS